jgi:hypothetical protein
MGAVLKQKHIQPISSRPNSEIIFCEDSLHVDQRFDKAAASPKAGDGGAAEGTKAEGGRSRRL